MRSPSDHAATTTKRLSRGRDFWALVKRLDDARAPKHNPGPRPLWVRTLSGQSSEALASTIFFHVLRVHLWAESRENEAPFLSTIAADLGSDLLDPDRDNRDNLPMKIGAALLEEARLAGVVETWRDKRNGLHVVFSRPTAQRFEKLLEGANPPPHKLTPPPREAITTHKPHAFMIQRPAEPEMALVAAHKVQSTAWRVNTQMLAVLLETPHRRNAHRKAVLKEASYFATFDRFYLPTFFDFRGRIYQDGGLLQYTGGSDYARSLLEFADGEVVERGSDAERWLRWHAQQMWGLDKSGPFGDGTDWLKRSLPRLLKKDAWRKAEHPFQFAAAILALHDVHEGRLVHLPVRVDASCSGLQHLAWLTADQDIAPHVNLCGPFHGYRARLAWAEGPRERDFYDLVAESAGQKRRRRRKGRGEPLTRKDCKGVVVPMLYGQTVGGATFGLLPDEWERRDPDEQAALLAIAEKDAKDIRKIAQALAPKSFGLLKWFKSVADDHKSAAIRWHTPSGFEVVQDYRHEITDSGKKPPQIQVVWEGVRTGLRLRTYSAALDGDQQVRSLAANVIHSLDAALLHELVGGSQIEKWAVAHDAFAVPAGWIETLLDVDLQRAIEQMYTTDRLSELAKAWRHEGVWPRGTLPREMFGGLRTLG